MLCPGSRSLISTDGSEPARKRWRCPASGRDRAGTAFETEVGCCWPGQGILLPARKKGEELMKGTQRATKNAIGKKNAKIQIVDNIEDLVNLVTENV